MRDLQLFDGANPYFKSSLTLQDVRRVEREMHRSFPDEYVDFLLAYNGIRFLKKMQSW